MKTSDTSEGDNSSLKKTFEEVVYEATPFSPGVLTVGGPAQKEDPFGDFLESQGINVVDVTPAQKEEWEDDYETERNKFTQYDTSLHGYVLNDSALKAFIASQIALAEARGREAGMEKAREIVTNMENPYDIDSHLTFFQGWDQCNADVRLAIIQELNNYVPR